MKKLKYYLIISLCVYGLVNIKLGKSHAYTINLTQISADSYASISLFNSVTGTLIFAENTGTSGADAYLSGTYTAPDGSSENISVHNYIGQNYGATTHPTYINGNIYSSANINKYYTGELIEPYPLPFFLYLESSTYTHGSYILNIVSDYGNTGNIDVTVSVSGTIGWDGIFNDEFIISGPHGLFYYFWYRELPFDITLEPGLDYMVSANFDKSSPSFVDALAINRNIQFEVMEPVPLCEGNFDCDGDVDGSDLVKFASNFGRTDCPFKNLCEGDLDNDGDVDGSDLAIFAADFGRTDCPSCQ